MSIDTKTRDNKQQFSSPILKISKTGPAANCDGNRNAEKSYSKSTASILEEYDSHPGASVGIAFAHCSQHEGQSIEILLETMQCSIHT